MFVPSFIYSREPASLPEQVYGTRDMGKFSAKNFLHQMTFSHIVYNQLETGVRLAVGTLIAGDYTVHCGRVPFGMPPQQRNGAAQKPIRLIASPRLNRPRLWEDNHINKGTIIGVMTESS